MVDIGFIYQDRYSKQEQTRTKGSGPLLGIQDSSKMAIKANFEEGAKTAYVAFPRAWPVKQIEAPSL